MPSCSSLKSASVKHNQISQVTVESQSCKAVVKAMYKITVRSQVKYYYCTVAALLSQTIVTEKRYMYKY